MFRPTEEEVLSCRGIQARFEAILIDDHTLILEIKVLFDNYDKCLFVISSRAGDQGRSAMNFYGM